MMKNFIGAGLVAAGALMFAPDAHATTTTTVNTTSNVVFLVDESGSMTTEHQFLKDVILDLDAGLDSAGVTDRSYGVVGFGASNPAPRTISDGILDSAADTLTEFSNLVLTGSEEDGYAAIEFARTAFNYAQGAAINFILVTDEDRDNMGNSLTYSSILSALKGQNILLNAIINNPFGSDSNSVGTALGIDSDGTAYIADGTGFTTDIGAFIGNGAGTTEDDYAKLALATGGAAWDLNKIRAGGDTAEAFSSAFVTIKVQEITTQPPSGQIPLPAGGWLLLTGLGGLAALRRKRRAA
ncbi:hypothetical protein RAZWK3B_10497 [Roseobacter sp. AzwK-3b]|uniref:VPLPA-CTERM sorting domain-containing protein n=1 Tax=Roseobacter sp. AzwK-3b TaxID=351016 RepID=UPI000156ADC7|nr:VPLPA-CTERM sorting domain-containing protein [Roseobacter sp. AzwK-3b]EDM69785.1 hypothetical protein RAZWK3B_10497 [Roseobacter sp. AzwK-3b]